MFSLMVQGPLMLRLRKRRNGLALPGTGGKDPGADMDALEKATAGVVVRSNTATTLP